MARLLRRDGPGVLQAAVGVQVRADRGDVTIPPRSVSAG